MAYAKTVAILYPRNTQNTKEDKTLIFVIILAIFVIVLAAYVIRADTRKRSMITIQNQEHEIRIRYGPGRNPKRKRRPKGQTGRKHPKKKRRKSNGID